MLSNGPSFLCKGLVKIFEDFEAHRKIVALPVPEPAKFDAIAPSIAQARPRVGPLPTTDSKTTAITVPVRAAQQTGVLVVHTPRIPKK